MTSIEWLIEEMMSKGFFKESVTLTNIDHLQYKAEEKHKQEMGDTWDAAIFRNVQRGYNASRTFEDFDDYYAETFVSNFKQFSLYEHKETITSADTQVSKTFLEAQPQLPQQDVDKLGFEDVPKLGYCEISDEEIEKQGNRLCWKEAQEAFKAGAKWYREKLNKPKKD
jgi:hypothetical protein